MKKIEAIQAMKFYKEKLYNGIFKDKIKAFDVAINALEKQIPKAPIHIHEEYEKHEWRKDKDGNVDEWAFSVGYCNGVVCERCYESQCIHCNPDYDNDACIVDKDICPNCKSEIERYPKKKYCSDCGQAINWNNTSTEKGGER